MELNQLKIFVAVAEEKHLTRAAERLFTSQPAVSAQIKSLEEQLGLKLFERTPKGMELTPAGSRLMVQAQATLDSASALLAQAKALHGNVIGELKVGTNSDMDFLRLPATAAQISKRHPNMTLSLKQSMSTDIVVDVRKGSLDSGFFFGPCSLGGLHIEKLADVPTAVVAPADWADKIANADIATLAALPWIYTTEDCPFYLLKEELFKDSPVMPNKTVFVDTEDSIRSFIKASAGISLLRKDDADKAEREGWGCRWLGQTPSCPLSIAVQSNRIREPIMEAWMNALNIIWNRHEAPQLQVI